VSVAGPAAGAPAQLSGAPAPVLHLPDEPSSRKAAWLGQLHDGVPLDDVMVEVADWLWERWRVLDGAGLDRGAFGAVLTGYRRELWLWLAGERTWAQCGSGLLGRIGRRLPA
jgi:hypothetical protein